MKSVFVDSMAGGFENEGAAWMTPWNPWAFEDKEDPFLFQIPVAVSTRIAPAAGMDIDLNQRLTEITRDLKNASAAWVYLRRWMVRIAVAGYLSAVPLKAAATAYSTASPESPDAVSNSSAAATAGPNPDASTTMPQLTVIGTSDKPKSLSGVKYQGPLVDTPQ